MSPLNAAICTTISYTLWVEWYYIKNNYLTLRYAPTYQISLTYLETKMLWPGQENTIKKTIIWSWGQRSRSQEGHYGMQHTALWSCTHIPNKYYLKNNYLTFRSKVRSHEGHYSTRHTALWSCTHIPNIIDQSRKTKMLWPRQENTI
jgi:hypothetical protein